MKRKKKIPCTYVWLGGYELEHEFDIRNKPKFIPSKGKRAPDLPISEVEAVGIGNWTSDGSSSNQSKGHNSDLILHPVKVVKDPLRANGLIAFCEVLLPDGKPHPTNHRPKLVKLSEGRNDWFAPEQEYFLMERMSTMALFEKGSFGKRWKPLGMPDEFRYAHEQASYYCGTGAPYVHPLVRKIVDEHAGKCNEAGLPIEGTNLEVGPSQAEFQIFDSVPAIDAADMLWIIRYLLVRIAEQYEVMVSFHPKPMSDEEKDGKWNGSGCHINFSTEKMRTPDGEKLYDAIIAEFKHRKDKHIAVYGKYNKLRLTGQYETAHIDDFRAGKRDRGASIRIPEVTSDNQKRLEDRRPAANMNPYLAYAVIVESLIRAGA